MREQGIRIERLGHVEIRAHLLPTLAVELLPLRREENDMNVAQPQFSLHRIADIEAILLGHHHVEKDKIRLLFAYRLQRVFPIAGRQKVHAVVFEFFERLLYQRA